MQVGLVSNAGHYSYGLADYQLGPGSFSEDARGRWYINITVKIEKPEACGKPKSIGIDLGLKEFAACSDGLKIDAQQVYRAA